MEERLQEVERPFDASELAAAHAENTKLREALAPFLAPFDGRALPEGHRHVAFSVTVTLGALLDARAALASAPASGEQEPSDV